MPVVSCPKCPTKLRVADGATGNVKCPKCTAIFPVTAPAPSAAFEVVDEEPVKPAPAKPASAAKPVAKAAAPAKNEFDFDDDTPKKKKRADDDDDDDDRPKKKKRADDDEDDDDDRPRSKSKRRRDDDDDDDDRPRKKKKGRRYADEDDDDDEDEYRPRNKGGNSFGNAKTGMLLLNISFWLYLASLAIITFGIFLSWVGAFDSSPSTRSSSSSRGSISRDDDDFGGGGSSSMEALVKLPGILGMANWVVALVGFSFCIAGPQRSRGMAITATSLAAAHLLFAGITFNNMSGGGGFGRLGGGIGAPTWLFMASTFPFLDALLPMLFYAGKFLNGDFIFAVLAGGCELARLIFALLLIKELSTATKDYDSADKAGLGVLVAAIISGVAAGLVLLVVVLLDAGITKSMSGLANITSVTLLLVYGGFTGMMVLPALASGGVRNSLARRARRG